MKKILSVALVLCMMVSLCSVFALMPAYASSDEYDTTGFTVTAKSANGQDIIGRWKSADEGITMTEEEAYEIWENGYNESTYEGAGWYDKDGKRTDSWSECAYYMPNISGVLTGTADALAGYWWGGTTNSSLPTCKYPLTFDIDLGGNKTISGVRLYGKTDSGADGQIKKYKVYVMFPDADETDENDGWTYLFTDGEATQSQQTLETSFGQNLTVKKVRIEILESWTKVGSGATKFTEGTSAYCYLSRIAILKPYNDGGSTYASAPTTAASAEELDEMRDVTISKAGYAGDNYAQAQTLSIMDDDLSTGSGTNGGLYIDFGEEITFSGFRYYPPKSYNNNQGGTKKAIWPVTKISDFGNLTTEVKYDPDNNYRVYTSVSKWQSYKIADFAYPETGSSVDYTKPITVDFGKNVTWRGIYINSWTHVPGSTPSAGNGGIGEIRLIKAKVAIQNNEVTSDINSNTDIEFQVDIPDGVTASVTDVLDEDGTSIGADNFTYASETLVIASDYVKNLEEGTHSLTVVFSNGNKVKVTVKRLDVTVSEYYLTSVGTNNNRGTEDLVLTAVGGKTIDKITFNEEFTSYLVNVNRSSGKIEAHDNYELAIASNEDGVATVKKADFATYFDLFGAYKDKGCVKLDVTMKDSSVVVYTVNLKNGKFKVEGDKVDASLFESNEILPDGDWTVEVSSARSSSPWQIVNKYASISGLLWHSGYSVVDGSAIPDSRSGVHWVEVDFGKATTVSGLRYSRRTDKASPWWSAEIYASKDGKTFELIKERTNFQFDSSESEWSHDIEFEADSYRSIRLKIAADTHACANYLHFLKPYTTVDGESTQIAENQNDYVFDSTFKFNLSDGATAITSVKQGTDALAEADYTVDGASLIVKADYIKTLAKDSATEFDVTFDNGNVVKVYIKRQDTMNVAYQITSSTTPSRILKITLPAGLGATGVKADGKSLSYSVEEGVLSVAAAEFRSNVDIYDYYKEGKELIVYVTLTNGQTLPYKIVLSNTVFKASDITLNTDKFESDEIKTQDDWTIEVDCSTGNNLAYLLADNGAKDFNWHSDHTAGSANKTGQPFYVDIDLGKETEFSGVRVYRRTGKVVDSEGNMKWWDTAGTWSYSTIYGRNSVDEEWVEIDPYTTISWDLSKDVEDFTKDIMLDATAKCRYVRLMVGNANFASAKYIRFITPKSSFKNAELIGDSVAMDFDLNEDAEAKFNVNGGIKLTGISYEGSPVAAEYVTMATDSVKISPYFFKDNGITSGSVDITASFAFGDDVTFEVKVGEVAGYTMEFEGINENGTVKAFASNEAIEGDAKEKASGDKVRNSDKLIFTAIPNAGYEVSYWSVDSTTPVYDRMNELAKKEWTVTTNSQLSSCPVSRIIDGKTGEYWHSDYGYQYGDEAWSGDPGEIWVEINCSYTIFDANKVELVPRSDRGTGISDYKFYIKETTDGDWILASEGTLTAGSKDNQFINFNKTYQVIAMRLELPELNNGRWSHVYIEELYLWSEKYPAGKVVRKGTASEDFEIDDRFTDMKVTVYFEEIKEGSAKVSANVNYATAEAPSTVAHGTDLTVKITPNNGYHAPEEVTVKKDGTALVEGLDYTYTRTDELGTITIKNVRGSKIEITGTAADYKNHVVMYADSYGASGKLPTSVQVVEGDTYVLEKSSLKLEGYTFKGWSYNDETYKAGDKFVMPAEDVVFTAVWEKKESGGNGGNGGSGGGGGSSSKKDNTSSGGSVIGGGSTGLYQITVDGKTVKLAHGSVISEPEAREGYVFKGYYLDEALTVPYANDGLTAGVTLYSAWTKVRTRSDLWDISGHWAEEYIGKLYEAGIVNGNDQGTYLPDSDITRAEFVQILYNISGMTSTGAHSFKDVKVGDWYSQAVAWAVNYGITSGTDDGIFSPNEKITREQMAAMIYRYAVTLMAGEWQFEENGDFTDSADIADYAKYQVRWAKAMEIISGRPDGSFGPKDNATRAESAAMLSRLIK